MRKGRRWLLAFYSSLVWAAFWLGACDGRPTLLPKSGGKAYELLVVGDRSKDVEGLFAQDVEGLPQHEPEFDVSAIDSADFNASLRLARNIVIVSINAELYTAVRVHYQKNVYARPQMVVHVNAPSLESLRRYVVDKGETLVELLRRSEINAMIGDLRTKRNVKAEQLVKKNLGVEMWIPLDMVSIREGQHFVWLSNNLSSGMQNIVVYRARPAGNVADFVAIRDSVMKVNIKGETDAMFMQTVLRSVRCRRMKEKGREITVCRGLWEMYGDAMGGPFVSHTLGDVTVEAFVFSPNSKKRNKLRQTEAALYTLKHDTDEQ